MVPKRRSQLACGVSDSAADHRVVAFANKASGLVPGSGPVQREEGLGDELAGVFGYISEELVIGDSGGVTKVRPSSPDSVVFFVGRFLFRIQEDLTSTSTCVAKHKISLGRGEILKAASTSCGREAWRRCVSVSSDGSSAAGRWIFGRRD
jgi:hypothetical protein